MNTNWTETENGISNEFIFKNFKEALEFVNQVGDLAEQMNHHPDIEIYDYKKVRIKLFTHSENAVTKKDYDLATKIDTLDFPKTQPRQ